MNKSLAIDTSTTHFTIACENNGVFIEYSMDNCLDHAKDLFININNILRKAALDIKSLDFITVGIGPGRFSGLRVAVSAVQAIAYTHNIKVITQSSLCSIAAVAINQFTLEKIAVAMDAGNNKIFFGCYHQDEENIIKPIIKDSVIEIKEFEFNQTDFYGAGNAWTKHSDHLQNGKIIVLDEADTVYPDAKTMITYAKNRFLAKEHTEPFDIQPNYLIDKVTN
tara:strand:- start:517 stop:1185 length:669 start_codon:yes stop_codon:yes gene_type:complete